MEGVGEEEPTGKLGSVVVAFLAAPFAVSLLIKAQRQSGNSLEAFI